MWQNEPMPAQVATEFQREFEGYQARIQAQTAEEADKYSGVVAGIKAQTQEILDKILKKSGIGIAQALKTVSGFEAEMAAMEKQLAQFKGLLPATAHEKFEEVRGQTWALLQECKTAAAKETLARAEERNRVLLEAEALALSTDWETSRARFEELRALWKKTGALGQSQDAMFGMLFENVTIFYLSRFESRARVNDPGQQAHYLNMRKNLVYSLEALTRFRAPQTGEKPAAPLLPLPFSEEEIQTNAAGKLLELGIKYNHILSLDPVAGTVKETKKIMEQWSKTGVADDESLPAFWKYYLDRVHTLLEIRWEL
jgi:hypothetical protein